MRAEAQHTDDPRKVLRGHERPCKARMWHAVQQASGVRAAVVLLLQHCSDRSHAVLQIARAFDACSQPCELSRTPTDASAILLKAGTASMTYPLARYTPRGNMQSVARARREPAPPRAPTPRTSA